MRRDEAINLLKSGTGGILVWNDLREGDTSIVDLQGADFHGIDFRTGTHINLSYVDLRGANLRGADLTVADLMGADLSGADLRGADLQGANLRGALLYGADLGGAYLYKSKLDLNAHWGNIEAVVKNFVKGVDFTRCNVLWPEPLGVGPLLLGSGVSVAWEDVRGIFVVRNEDQRKNLRDRLAAAFSIDLRLLEKDTRGQEITAYIDPGSAPAELLEDILLALSGVYRAHGGSGLEIIREERRSPTGEEVGG